MSVPIICLYE